MEAPEQLAMRMLAQRALSVHELRQRLTRRGHAPAAVEEALEAMARYRYVDDEALAHGVARAASTRGRGPAWVRQTLRRRGLPEALADRAAATAFACEADTLASARALVARRGKTRGRVDTTDRIAVTRAQARDFRFLVGRGFSPTVARSALDTPPTDDPFALEETP